ncbi:uncharacterized protein LOC142333915 isoform X1 [Lycorma delicatula]|uniref:uncharacterized protein LOC142333915 isoform X1 n=1 Tax=Lycorma delicatula TaxID=130591 RepID=UPI003F51AB79
MDAPTNDSVLEENPLSLPIKKEDMHETGQQEYLFVHLAKTDDDKLTIFKQSMDAQTDSSFFDEDPLSSSIKQEIKHETERTVHLIAPVAMIDDKLTTSRQSFYPINFFKKWEQQVNTPYMFLTDIDFLPMFDLYSYLKKINPVTGS